MAKTAKPVNRQRLIDAIATAESAGPLSNRNLLYGAAAEAYNVACGARGLEYITPSIVLLRIKEWNLAVLTPMGKRGRPAGCKIERKLDENGNPIPRKTRKGRNRRPPSELMEKLRQEFNHPQYDGMLRRIENGSLAARAQANCLSCAGQVKNEIKFCQCFDCVWHDIRPYQEKQITSVSPTVSTELVVVDAIDTPLKQTYSELLPILA